MSSGAMDLANYSGRGNAPGHVRIYIYIYIYIYICKHISLLYSYLCVFLLQDHVSNTQCGVCKYCLYILPFFNLTVILCFILMCSVFCCGEVIMI